MASVTRRRKEEANTKIGGRGRRPQRRKEPVWMVSGKEGRGGVGDEEDRRRMQRPREKDKGGGDRDWGRRTEAIETGGEGRRRRRLREADEGRVDDIGGRGSQSRVVWTAKAEGGGTGEGRRNEEWLEDFWSLYTMALVGNFIPTSVVKSQNQRTEAVRSHHRTTSRFPVLETTFGFFKNSY